MFALLLVACWSKPDPSELDAPGPPPERPVAASSTAIVLTAATATSLELPASSRPQGQPAGERIPLSGPVEPAGTAARRGVAVWSLPMPVERSLLPSRDRGSHHLGAEPPPGFAVLGPDGPLAFHPGARRPYTWGFDENSLFLGLPNAAGTPDPAAFAVVFPRATQAENALNRATSPLDGARFVERAITAGTRTHRGLFLPAPSRATWSLTVPEGGVLSLGALLVSPNLRTAAESDGATVRALIRAVVADAAQPSEARAGFDTWKQRLLAENSQPGDAERGRRVFYRRGGAGCYQCHTIDGRGGPAGPELSQLTRQLTPDRLLESIVDPSKEIAPLFVNWTVLTSDGRQLTGVLLRRNSQNNITLADAQGRIHKVSGKDVDELLPMKKSLMPDGLPERMTEQEFRDLLAFLQSLR